MTVKVSVACQRARLLARHQLSVPASTIAGAADRWWHCTPPTR